MKYVVSSWGAALSLSALSARLIARHDPSALSKRECTPLLSECWSCGSCARAAEVYYVLWSHLLTSRGASSASGTPRRRDPLTHRFDAVLTASQTEERGRLTKVRTPLSSLQYIRLRAAIRPSLAIGAVGLCGAVIWARGDARLSPECRRQTATPGFGFAL